MEKCFLCDGTGQYKEPKSKDKYEKIFDKYDGMGIFNMDTCRNKALTEVGYTLVKCSKCNGTGEVEGNL